MRPIPFYHYSRAVCSVPIISSHSPAYSTPRPDLLLKWFHLEHPCADVRSIHSMHSSFIHFAAVILNRAFRKSRVGWLSIFWIGCVCGANAQTPPQHTLSGYVEDASSGEKLIGAVLYEPTLREGAITNRYGFFSLTLPADSLRLVVSYIGFRSDTLAVRLDRDLQLNFALHPLPLEIQTIEVEAERLDPIQEPDAGWALSMCP